MIQSVLKRDNKTEIPYDRNKIKIAIEKANREVSDEDKISSDDIDYVISIIERSSESIINVEDIQNTVEDCLMELKKYSLARAYITYRYRRALIRKANTTDTSILSLVRGENSEVQRENSNKRAVLNSTQRDLIAGEVSKDLTRRVLLPQYLIDAHDKGIIHFHDMDYFLQHMFNCCLPNFRDMLKNGTCINGVMIRTPNSFRVACNQVTQIMANISSNQYGGQTFYLDVLGEYLAYTKKKFEKRTRKTLASYTDIMSEENLTHMVDDIVKEDLKVELTAGIQTIQYQINTLMTTNGQSPFVTIFMYLRKDDPFIEENAMIFEELLRQRIDGIENENGEKSTPAFPKLVYVLTEDNCLDGGKYDYLTKIAIECNTLRMYPDYISEKVMLENYGDVFGCMGCVDAHESVQYSIDNLSSYSTSEIENLWNYLSERETVHQQVVGSDDNLVIHLENTSVQVKDIHSGELKYVNVTEMNKNKAYKWLLIILSTGQIFKCTQDHPLVINGSSTAAIHANIGDRLTTENGLQDIVNVIPYDLEDGDYCYDLTTETGYFTVSGIDSHNCRSFLSAWKDPVTGENKWEGRFNQGVVTVNLPHAALASSKNEEEFWKHLDEALNLAYDALMCRHKALEDTISDVSPLHWQYGGIARLKPGEKINQLLHGGYSTISLGYIGLYECTKYITGHSHTDDIGREFSLRVMNRLRSACDAWKASTGISFGLYGTPAESTCYTLEQKDEKQFGIVEGVTDKGFYTNSYHIDSGEEIDAFSKFELESIYQKISSGGAISYVEIPYMGDNEVALEDLVRFIYDKMQYAEFNTRSDSCECGFHGEIRVNEDGVWECPKCHTTDMNKMDITRRTCGYVAKGKAGWNVGKTKEINGRVIHLY